MFYIKERNEWLGKQLLRADSDVMFAGVVTGHQPGEVWVNDLARPSTALVWSGGLEGFCFMGNPLTLPPQDGFESFIDGAIIPFLKEKGIRCFEFSAEGESWVPALHDALGSRDLQESYQYVYKSDPPAWRHSVDGNPAVPEPFRAVRLDARQLHEWELDRVENGDFLIRYVEQYWGTLSNFLVEGFGYAALTDGNAIAGLAVSSAKFGMTRAIGVETLEDYRRLGLSSSLVKLLLNDFHNHGITAWWDCMESNIASQKTAEKAGLTRSHRYKINWFTF